MLTIVIITGGITGSYNVFAASTQDRLTTMEKRLRYLDQPVATQDKAKVEKNQQISKLTNNGSESWLQNVSIGGLIEVEAQHVSPDNANHTSDIYVATVGLGVAAQINDWTETEIVLLYEDDGTHSGEIDVDTATIRIADPDSNWFVTAGQYVLPFGNFPTNLISDPITLDMVEITDSAIEAGFESNGFNASAYVFNGDQEAKIHNGGINLGYSLEAGNYSFTSGIGWINDMGESDSVVDDATAQTNKTSAWTAFAKIDAGDFTLIGEYVSATESLNAYSTTDKPSAFNIEAAYDVELMDKSATIAIAFQGTSETSVYAGGLDEKRHIAAFSMELMEGTSLGIEYMKAHDYASVDTKMLTAQLAIEL